MERDRDQLGFKYLFKLFGLQQLYKIKDVLQRSLFVKNNFLKVLGPGIIMAGAAVGVSHLVQSTRAGAAYGFGLIALVLLINLLKYPFFEFGPRYAIATGESLIHGYRRTGKWAVVLFLILTLGTMFSILAAVSTVTIGILSSIFPNLLSFSAWTILLFGLCVAIITVGRYNALDKAMKVIIVLLTLSTLAALAAAAWKGYNPQPQFSAAISWSATDIAFIIALAGWMPSAIDLSVWHSLWTLAKIKQTSYTPTLREALTDFNIGYLGTVVIALAFLLLGAYTMYGSGITFSQNGTEFATQLFELYTKHIGPWAYPLIALAAATTMFSTTLTVIDAYSRVMQPVTLMLVPQLDQHRSIKYLRIFWTTVVIVGAFLVMTSFANEMRLLVDIATTLSFITAPILGYLNYRAVTGSHVPESFRPGKWLRALSISGLIILTAFALYFIYTRIG